MSRKAKAAERLEVEEKQATGKRARDDAFVARKTRIPTRAELLACRRPVRDEVITNAKILIADALRRTCTAKDESPSLDVNVPSLRYAERLAIKSWLHENGYKAETLQLSWPPPHTQVVIYLD